MVWQKPLVMAAVSAIPAIIYLLLARNYALGTAAQPGPGLYPVLVGLFLLMASIGTALESALSQRQDQTKPHWPVGQERRRLLTVMAVCLSYLLVLPYLGDLLSGAVAILVILRAMGMTRWVTSVALAVVLAAVIHYVFVVLLGVMLPQGVF